MFSSHGGRVCSSSTKERQEEVGWNCGRISKSQFKEAWGRLDVLKHTLEL